MNIKGFFVATLSSALDLGIASPEDVVRHVTPDVLAQYLPRPLWARLLTACLGAPRVDAQLVIETIGVPNLCEHIPEPLMWTCIAEIATRALAGQMPILTRPVAAAKAAIPAPVTTRIPTSPSTRATTPASGVPTRPTPASGTPTTPGSGATRTPLAPPPPEARPAAVIPPKSVGPTIPSLSTATEAVLADLEGEEDSVIAPPAPNSRMRTPTGQRFRQTGTGIGRLANNQVRRPQAQAAPPPAQEPARKRGNTDADDFSIETDIGSKDDWKNALAVEDEQLVDWTASEETVTHTEDFANNAAPPGRKR